MKKKSKDTMVALFGVFLVLGLLGVMTKDEAKVGKVIDSQHVTWQWGEDTSLPTIEPVNETYLPALIELPKIAPVDIAELPHLTLPPLEG
tara:strand:- start:611 stop:880 length:270 start_codon:yes stop_codon:yes gene_type:complete